MSKLNIQLLCRKSKRLCFNYYIIIMFLFICTCTDRLVPAHAVPQFLSLNFFAHKHKNTAYLLLKYCIILLISFKLS